MDIIIPLGRDSRWNDNELRYALRSIEKYLSGYGRIWIIGKRRGWLNDLSSKYAGFIKNEPRLLAPLPSQTVYGVWFIDAEEKTLKTRSIFEKILKAAKDERVSDPFVMWHDDHFLLKPLNVNEIAYWKWRTLDKLALHANGTYKKIINTTIAYFNRIGISINHFDLHYPIIFEKEKIIELDKEDWGQDILIKSLYCNKYQIEGVEMTDCTVGVKPKDYDEIKKRLEGKLFFSTSNKVINIPMIKMFKDLYPEKSKYETL